MNKKDVGILMALYTLWFSLCLAQYVVLFSNDKGELKWTKSM